MRSTVAESRGISPVRSSRNVPGAPPRAIASMSSAASSSPRPAFLPVARQNASMSASVASSGTPRAPAICAIGHLEIGADQAEDVQQFRGGGRAFAVGLRALPVGDGLVEQRRDLFRGDERVHLRHDEEPLPAEERHRAIRVDDRRQLDARLERRRPRSRIGLHHRFADFAERALRQKFGRAADEDHGRGFLASICVEDLW